MKRHQKEVIELLQKDTITQIEYDTVIEYNKLGISFSEIRDKEEHIGKQILINIFMTKFREFKNDDLNNIDSLIKIHSILFEELYEYSGLFRNISFQKNNLPFLPHRYFLSGISYFNELPTNNINEIVRKYVEFNYIHPFYDGNGRTGRLWLDALIYQKLEKVIAWNNISPSRYLRLMHESRKNPDEIEELTSLIANNLIGLSDNNIKEIFRGADLSYQYEGFNKYRSYDIYLEGNYEM